MIRIDNITIKRSGKTLFEDFTLQLNSTDNLIVSGDNGSGKTTLLEVINGSLHPRTGKVVYDFLDESYEWDERFRKRSQLIHFIPAQALHDVLGYSPDLHYQQRYYSINAVESDTVRGFLGPLISGLESLNLPPALNIASLLDIPVTRLSNGQIRKIIIIRQLLRHIPRVILFDYPFEGLDGESRESLIRFIDHLHQAFEIQFVLTGHNDNFPRCMNRRVWLENFRVVKDEEYFSAAPAHASEVVPKKQQQIGIDSPIVEFQDVDIQYGTRHLLRGFNWLVRRGERWALTGKNGSGKTTIFSLIYADHPFAYSQAVSIFGRRRGTGESIWDIKKRISYLGPEQMHLMDTVNLAMPGRAYILSRAGKNQERRLNEVADFFHASDLLYSPLRMLSSGELQLVHLMIIFLDPKELFLLDEPFQFLDPLRKCKVSEFLTSKLDQTSTLILITHDEEDVRDWTQQRLHLG